MIFLDLSGLVKLTFSQYSSDIFVPAHVYEIAIIRLQFLSWPGRG